MSDRIRHTTGRCPVAPSVFVRVWYEDPLLPTTEFTDGEAGSFEWSILGDGEDIAFYQVAPIQISEAQ